VSLGVHIRTLKILIRSVEPVPESEKAKASVKPQVMEVMELIGVHDGKVVARMVVHTHPREPRIPVKVIVHIC